VIEGGIASFGGRPPVVAAALGFQDQFAVAAERQRECADDHDEQLQHAVIVAGVGARFNADEFWRCSPSGLTHITRSPTIPVRFRPVAQNFILSQSSLC
jgi:hypothetical protein